MLNPEKMIIESVDTAVLLNPDESLMMMMDELKDVNITNGSEIVYQTGKMGSRLAGFDRNKTASVSFTNAYLVGGAIEAQTGSDKVVASADEKLSIPTHDIMAVKKGTNTATLTHVPVGSVPGAEVKFVYVLVNGVQGDKLEVGADTAEGVFTVDAAAKTLTFDPSFAAESDVEIIAFYTYETDTGVMYQNRGDAFSKKGKLVLDLVQRDVCDDGKKYHTRMVFPAAKVDGNFDISVGNDPAVHAFKAEALQDICSIDKTMWQWYVVE